MQIKCYEWMFIEGGQKFWEIVKTNFVGFYPSQSV